MHANVLLKGFAMILNECGVLSFQIPSKSVTSIIDGLKKSYIEKLRPLEKTYQFHDFVSPLLVSIALCFLCSLICFTAKVHTETIDYKFLLKAFANYPLFISTTLVKVSCKNNM